MLSCVFVIKLILERRTAEESQQAAAGNMFHSADFCFCFGFRFSVAFLLSLCKLSAFVALFFVCCHALCCLAQRAWFVVCSHAFLFRCQWCRAPVDREGALRLNVQVQVFRRLSFLADALVYLTSLFQQVCVVLLVLNV